MTFLVVANFKSHKTRAEVTSWFKDVDPVAKNTSAAIVVAPSFPHLSLFSDLHSTTPFIQLAAQDVSPFPPGSYTGAVNAKQLQDLGVSYCLIGHSERRRYFHESAGDVANKAQALVEAGITPIICVAEEDLAAQKAALDDQLANSCVFCFEPPTDIGGAETAAPEQISQITKRIKDIFTTEKVMYGGSVNEGNIDSLLPFNLYGVLVASASLAATNFNQLIQKLHGKV